MLFPCTWWLTSKYSLNKCNTSLGIIFQIDNNSVNLILPLQITRNNDDQYSFQNLPIVCDRYTPLLNALRCMRTESFSKECKTTCVVIVNWHVPTLVPKMHSKERVKFHVFSHSGLQVFVVIHRGDYFSN